MIIFLDYIFGMKSSLPFFLTNKRFILSISILFFLLVCGKDNTQKQKEWELEKLNLGINFGFPSFIQIPAPLREFPKIFDIKPSFAIQSCEIKISGGFLADGYNSFCGDYRKENSYPTKLAYVQKAEISPESKIFGELQKVDLCFPDLKDEFLKAKNQNDNVSEQEAKNAGLKTGTYGSGIWGALIDKLCTGVGCDAHCKLNKDAPGVNRLIFNPCDGNIQKDAYYEVESRAISSTIYHLDKFCRNAPNLCR
jgi:hypothetical protein